MLFHKHEECGCHKDATGSHYTSYSVFNYLLTFLLLMINVCIAITNQNYGYVLLQINDSKNTFRCNLRASIFQTFPGGQAPRSPNRSMLSVFHTLHSYM